MLIARALANALLMTLAVAPRVAAQEPDWTAASRETLAHLQSMIRMNTVNPPGNELQLDFGTRMIYGAIVRVAR